MVPPDDGPPASSPLDPATLDAIPDIVIFTGADRGTAYFNRRWLAFTGVELLGDDLAGLLDSVHPDDRERVAEAVADARRENAGFNVEMRLRRHDGVYVTMLGKSAPFEREGRVAGWIGTFVDIDEQRSGREELAASEARSRELADALPQLIGLSTADGALISVNATYRAYTGRSNEEVAASGWLGAIHPDDVAQLTPTWTRAARAGERCDTQYRLRRYDGVYRWFLNTAIPVRDADGTITAWIGTATDIDERKRAEDGLRVLNEANAAFGASLDTWSALERVAAVAAAHLADWCSVHLYDDRGQLRPAVVAHADASKVRLAREVLRRFPVREGDEVQRVALSGQPRRYGAGDSHAQLGVGSPEQDDFARELGLRAVMLLPLVVEGEHFGVMSLALSETQRAFDDEDERVGMLVAQRAAIALFNARLFERQREVARTLQSAFLPPALPEVDDVAFDAVYAPGTRDLTVGGDWYDAFTQDGGGIGLSIGDVAGHGLAAAVPMGKMRQTFRALAAVEADPAHALAAADAVLRSEHPDIFVTAFVARYEAARYELLYANAGHPPPAVRDVEGKIRRLDAAGLPLGLATFGELTTRRAQLAPGELFVAFTDGLVEVDRDILSGERALLSALAHPAFAIVSRPALLLRVLLVPSLPGDDVAIMTMRTGGGADWSFDANDAAAAQAARASFAARLTADGYPPEKCLGAEVVFGEILGNVARYTPGPVDIGVHRDADGLVLTALDRGAGFVWSAGRPDEDSENGRGLFLIEALGRGVRSEHLDGFGTYLEVRL